MTSPKNTSSGTPITAEALVALGYRIYPPGLDGCERLFQRSVSDEHGRLYFLNFREWKHQDRISWDAQLACDSSTGGYLWATVREDTIEGAEDRMKALWKASGSVRYDAI